MNTHTNAQMKKITRDGILQNGAYYNERAVDLRNFDHPQTALLRAVGASLISALGHQLGNLFEKHGSLIGSAIHARFTELPDTEVIPGESRGRATNQWLAIIDICPSVPTWSEAEQQKYPFIRIGCSERSVEEFLAAHKLPDCHHCSDDIIRREADIHWNRLSRAQRENPKYMFPAIFEQAWASFKDNMNPNPSCMVYPLQDVAAVNPPEELRNSRSIGFYFHPTDGRAVRAEAALYPDNLRRIGKLAMIHRY